MWTLQTDSGTLAIQPLGGMIARLEFETERGIVAPLITTDWADGPQADAIPPVIRHMQGEWFCLPFGAPAPPAGLPAHWKLAPTHPQFNTLHGHCANGLWSLEEQAPNSIRISFVYPSEHPVRKIGKHFSLENGKLSIQVEVETKEDCQLAVGIHPVFRLSDEPGQTQIQASHYEFAHSFPVDFVPEVSRMLPDTTFSQLEAAPSKSGSALDLTSLPFEFPAEEVVQICNAQGNLSIEHLSAGYTATLEWQAQDFGNCLIWISNGGRTGFPFEGKFRGLGIEPNAAAFGVGSPISASPDNPLAKLGAKTAIAFKAGEPWQTQYSISVSSDTSI